MGQKTNPNILRLGTIKNWKVEFFEKKNKELPLYIFNDLEIYEYIERFLRTRGIFIHDYRQFYSNKTLNLYISYFVSPKINFKSQVLLKKNTGENKIIINEPLKLTNEKFLNSNKISNNSFINSKKMYYSRQHLKATKFNNNILDFNSSKVKNSLKDSLKVISNYTKHKFDIVINFSCINKDFTNYFSIFKNKKIRMLQKFKFTSFFKEGLELLFHVAFNTNSARLLSTFISNQLKILKTKQINFFFAFIKRTLTVLTSSNLSKLKGVKIIVRGRLSKNSRAKNKILIIGDVAVQTLNSHIDYHQSTTHNNASGSYGVKVWIVEK